MVKKKLAIGREIENDKVRQGGPVDKKHQVTMDQVQHAQWVFRRKNVPRNRKNLTRYTIRGLLEHLEREKLAILAVEADKMSKYFSTLSFNS